MKQQLDIAALSKRYCVRRMTEADADAIAALCSSNPQYYEACGVPVTREDILKDLTLCPPGKTLCDKYFLGFYDGVDDGSGGEQLTAILDLITDYPDTRTAYIGLFMVDGARAGQGLGTALLKELFPALKAEGFGTVRLCYQKDNPQSGAFWVKNGFAAQKEVPHAYGTMIAAQRELQQKISGKAAKPATQINKKYGAYRL